jgi:hypothetical protein
MCLIAQKHIPIIGGAAATAIVVVLLFYQGIPVNEAQINIDEIQDAPIEPVAVKTYKINTECELIYSFAYSVYPDDQQIPPIVVADMAKKYPDFEPWKEILVNNETRKAFLSEPMSQEFSDVLVTSIMAESSINPALKDIAMHITDPQGVQKIQDDFEKYGCQAYFDSRVK